MKIPGNGHLTYCLNIHPGESWVDQRNAITQYSADVKRIMSPRTPFGLGLRLGRRAVDDLADPLARTHVRAWLEDMGFYAFTVNAFPYGKFHGTAVKEAVYAPDWRTAERFEYTIAVADVLADLLPDGVPGSISTVPCSYREWIRGEEDERLAVRNLALAAWALDAVAMRTGKIIALALEPEPDCFLETTSDCVRFWNQSLIPWGVAALRERAVPADMAETCLRRHVGVCLDTCHMALQFESPADSLRTLLAEGIAVPKVQLSAALRGAATSDARDRLAAFVDPVYLHQTRIRRRNGVERWADLTAERLAAMELDGGSEVRSHFHVPLHFQGVGDLGSTAGDLTPEFLRAASAAGFGHLEIETYTYHVLPEGLRALNVADSITREYAAVLGKMDCSLRA